MQKTNTSVNSNQQGVVTIVIVILIMLLMSLIVLAMSRNSTREQRQALDRQLNSQAFYAAESGVNDFLKNIDSLPDDSDDCDDPTLTGPLLPDSVIEVTCVLYDKTPDTLNWGEIKLSSAKLTPIQTDDPDGIDTLNISFEGKDVASPRYDGCNQFNGGKFPPRSDSLSNSCTAGVLRLEIIRTDDPTREHLLEDTTILFIVPSSSGGSGSYAYNKGEQGVIRRANCAVSNSPRDCKLDITGLDLPQNQRLYLSMRSIYRPNSLNTGSNVGSFVGSQILVDSTGKANDVLKRIQTSIPVSALSNSLSPSFSVQSSSDICKLLQVTPSNTTATECSVN